MEGSLGASILLITAIRFPEPRWRRSENLKMLKTGAILLSKSASGWVAHLKFGYSVPSASSQRLIAILPLTHFIVACPSGEDCAGF